MGSRGLYYRRLSATPRIEESGYAYATKADRAIAKWTRYVGYDPVPADSDAWPVHIRFNAQNRVDRIKIGTEVVEASN